MTRRGEQPWRVENLPPRQPMPIWKLWLLIIFVLVFVLPVIAFVFQRLLGSP